MAYQHAYQRLDYERDDQDGDPSQPQEITEDSFDPEELKQLRKQSTQTLRIRRIPTSLINNAVGA
jgi:hypothetical protein